MAYRANRSVDGSDSILPEIFAGASVDRLVAGSLRMQPQELLGGQAAGTIATIAITKRLQARDADADAFRMAFLNQGVV